MVGIVLGVASAHYEDLRLLLPLQLHHLLLHRWSNKLCLVCIRRHRSQQHYDVVSGCELYGSVAFS